MAARDRGLGVGTRGLGGFAPRLTRRGRWTAVGVKRFHGFESRFGAIGTSSIDSVACFVVFGADSARLIRSHPAQAS